ncbi:hypothetical protein CPB83DRAFT_851708 [Crepidotus variabilis]|uniref:Uncharacterized protein n=1 Tax=Crepidotus variabilis TaxID=179855 RepID=A0A9P6EJ58_9AGAR|nr:hypothetical protein CPB83DRAFT_851708 [Crepidotus variabilis]
MPRRFWTQKFFLGDFNTLLPVLDVQTDLPYPVSTAKGSAIRSCLRTSELRNFFN